MDAAPGLGFTESAFCVREGREPLWPEGGCVREYFPEMATTVSPIAGALPQCDLGILPCVPSL